MKKATVYRSPMKRYGPLCMATSKDTYSMSYDTMNDQVKLLMDDMGNDKHTYTVNLPFEVLEQAYKTACKSKRIKHD